MLVIKTLELEKVKVRLLLRRVWLIQTYYQQTLLNKGRKISIVEKPTEPFKGVFDKTIFDNITTPKKWCTNKLCYCTGDCQRMIKVPVELENLDLLFNITERSEQFSRNSISKALNNVST